MHSPDFVYTSLHDWVIYVYFLFPNLATMYLFPTFILAVHSYK